MNNFEKKAKLQFDHLELFTPLKIDHPLAFELISSLNYVFFSKKDFCNRKDGLKTKRETNAEPAEINLKDEGLVTDVKNQGKIL